MGELRGGDLLVRGGTVVDGTGAPGRVADVRIRGGVIAEIGPDLTPQGEPEIDASGAVVAPGFVDAHTHFDPSLWWDPSADPMPGHGVTTVVQGNCSLSLAPLTGDTAARDKLLDAFSYIEDMPPEAFRTGIPWNWTTWAEYRDRFDALGSAVHVAALVGHSTLRAYAMGEAADQRAATADERAALAAALQECLAAGAFGLSTSFVDSDRAGNPVASRYADDEEFAALAQALHAAGRTVFEFVPHMPLADKLADIERIHRACAGTAVRGSWTQLGAGGRSAADVPVILEQAGRTQAEGAGVFPQVSARSFDIQINFDRTIVFNAMPHWNAWVQVDRDEKLRCLADPAWRDKARAEWDEVPYALFPKGRMHKLRAVRVSDPALERYVGCFFDEILADHPGEHEADVFMRWLADNKVDLGLAVIGLGNDDPDAVAELLRDPRVVVGASDAGAHVQMMCGAGDSTLLLTRHVRERGDLTIEEAVQALTSRPAEIFGIRDRGILAPGYAGDLAVFALDELTYELDYFVDDMPDGSARLTRPHGNYRATVAAGVPTHLAGSPTGARPCGMLDASAAAPR
ncbi:N-acyl-D-amino-acid deacylase family protein [Yinghuangia soli]|uniref:Amidohydrolase family protein n=1 Tax=Yinghuangia soli TaxID=2908204 RepID=A0AA41Q999_9ACTN|nr:amidohydrolase family protein [Yinghuangia soli]MCF2533285.1 amidohydrolase family protein [Yinghuangia soli]